MQSKYNAFTIEAKNSFHHYRCSKPMDRNLALQNPDIQGSIPTSVWGSDHKIDKKHVTQSPRRRKDSIKLTPNFPHKTPAFNTGIKNPGTPRWRPTPSCRQLPPKQCVQNVHTSGVILWVTDQ